ncbi:MAG: DUF732 domain-containing protein [Mycobacterium sp.]|nr:DUF732 domain-containing protein [Mycobacterium sp.]
MVYSRMTSAGLVAAGLIVGAALFAGPASADPSTGPGTDQAGGNLDSLGLGNIDPGNAAEFAQSVCPLLAEPGQQVADAAAQASDGLGQPLPGTMFAGAAISMFCPAAINSMANGQSPIPLPMLSGLGNLGGFGN